MTEDGGRGRRNGEERLDADLDEEPLDASEAAAGAERAAEPVPEALPALVERVVAGLADVARRPAAPSGEELVRGGRAFAVLHPDSIEVALEGPVARAALATPDTMPSARGAGWVRFTPRVMDRFAADRAAAWLEFAHRRAGEAATH